MKQYEDYDRFDVPSYCSACLDGGHYSVSEIEFRGYDFCEYCFRDKKLVFDVCGLESNKQNNEDYKKELRKHTLQREITLSVRCEK